MNLKEAFRYQTFLDNRFNEAACSVQNRVHAFNLTKKHLRSKANPDAEDKVEEVVTEEFFKNDDVIDFMLEIIKQRGLLGEAIGKAKGGIPFDLDAAISSNKFRQKAAGSIDYMLKMKESSKTSKESDYKFNAEGNQVSYYYDVEYEYTEAFNRANDKSISRNLSKKADEVSADIDAAMINTLVDYKPPFDVNCSFEDVMNEFLSNRADT